MFCDYTTENCTVHACSAKLQLYYIHKTIVCTIQNRQQLLHKTTNSKTTDCAMLAYRLKHVYTYYTPATY